MRLAVAGSRSWNSFSLFAVLSVSSPPIEISASHVQRPQAFIGSAERCDSFGVLEMARVGDIFAWIRSCRAYQDTLRVPRPLDDLMRDLHVVKAFP